MNQSLVHEADAEVGATSRSADAVADAPLAFRLMHWFMRLLVWLFFREVEVVGLEHVPPGRGGVVVSWHPNGLVDPGLIITRLPRRIVFGARHGLFRYPLLGRLIRSIGSVPIRTGEGPLADDRRRANAESLDGLARQVADGRLTALFPEGISHDAPHPMELKTGAARLYYRARALQREGEPPPVIIPVGLHYDEKRLFRSRALVRFHPPIILAPDLDVKPAPDEPPALARDRARALTSEIGRVLHEVVLATEDWTIHYLIKRARSLMRAERAHRLGRDPGPVRFSDMARGFARIRAGYLARRRSDPEAVADLQRRLSKYDDGLRRLGIEDHELDRSPRLVKPWIALVLQMVLVFFLLPPLLALGYLVNGPAALFLLGACKAASKNEKDEATLKVLGGALLFPLTWVGVGILGGMGYLELRSHFPQLPDTAVLHGILLAVLSALGGALALRWLHLAQETLRSVRVRIVRARRRHVLEGLKAERAALHDALMALRRGVDLRDDLRTPLREASA
jgi:1-acyl-sn-glycerol-3-phosphate acyltransferase